MQPIRMIIRIVVAAMMILITNCGKDEPTSSQNTDELLRAHVWLVEYTNIDGVFSELYEGMTLAFGPTTYTTTDGKSLWKPSGTWEFLDDSQKTILRDDGLELEIVTITTESLVLSFYWDSTILDGGRTSSLKGQYEMTFKRKL